MGNNKVTRKITSIVLVITMIISGLYLTGCANTEQNIIIKKDGSASVNMYINIDRKAYLDECCEYGEVLSEEEIKTIDANMEAQGATIVTVDEKEYYRMAIVENNKLNNKELLGEFYIKNTVAYITGSTFYWNTSAKAIYEEKLQEVRLDQMGITLDQILQVPIKLSVQFSKEIVNYENGEISDDNDKKIYFDLQGEQQTILFASTGANITRISTEKKITSLNKTGVSKITKLTPNKVTKKSKKTGIKYKITGVKTTNGYQIQYGTRKNFKNARTKTVKKTSGSIVNLKRKTKYYVRVRVRKSNYAGINVYGKWSPMKTVRTN